MCNPPLWIFPDGTDNGRVMVFARWAVISQRVAGSDRPSAEALREPLRMAPPPWLWIALTLAGIGCRVVQYAWDRSFWVDEASLVLNIRERTASMLMGALDFNQAAPPLFLLIERGLYRVFGGSELSLRLFPLVSGCVSVILFAALARRMLKPWMAIVALALFCFSDRLIWHATEVKPYGVDACVAVALTLVAFAGRSDVRKLIGLCGLATVAVWLSYPAVLVFAGLSLTLLPAMARRGARGVGLYVLCNLPVVLSFAALMWVVKAQHNQALGDYWAEDFLPFQSPIPAVIWLG
ncbi:MAG TPA: glycosyltransferase family 39 protein, partial [Tepidisphaeraceae bacterium]|nr:glycosyltransferase family 39 protein [Tepidisphaeraceae bacterium]